MITSFYSKEELQNIGFKKMGSDVLISKKASIYSPEKISIGDNVRIDDFCILSGDITLGSTIHISAYAALYGSHGIIMEDFSQLSVRSVIFSEMDDLYGNHLAGPMHPYQKRSVKNGTVVIKKHAIIATNSTILPNLTVGEGSVVGAHSLVTKSLEEWGIYVGVPARRIKDRSKGLLKELQ
jgi:galactoside O-acetyltransferase